MDDADEFSSTGVLFEDCEMSSTNIQMRDLVLKFLVNLRSDEATEMTQMNELEAICQITRDVLSDGNQSEEEECFGKMLWIADINSAMERFPESVSVQETACRCLTALLQERPSLCKFIGQEMGQLPLPHNISVAMNKHWDLSALFKSVCDVVLMLLSCGPHLQQDFAKLDLHSAILLKISTSQETQELVKAFQVLVYISRDNPAFKEKLLKEDILFSISGVFNVLPSDHEVLKQAVTLLRTLAEGYPLVTHQCIVEEIHLSLLHILKQCKMCVSLLEVAIETLDMFCTAQGISDILVTSGCVEVICDLMKRHEKNPGFQVKALTMLQHLLKSAEDVVRVLIPEIKRVMESYPKSCEIQQYGCEMFYNIAKDDHETAMKLIMEGYHGLFFQILANFEDDFVLNSAADCIYLLACEHDLKNLMLLQMCAVGNTTAVSLLLHLSADVNYNEGGETPLSVACKTNNLELVQFLLAKGVSDMHNPLTLCLENRHRHKLAGFLLKRMGHDEDGGTISLTGLKLGALKKEWLAPSLLGSKTYSYHIESRQWLNLIHKSRKRLSVSTVSSRNDEDVLAELSTTTDLSSPEDMTSDQGSPNTSRDISDNVFDDDDSFFGSDNDTPQSRQRSVSRLSLGHSLSASHLMTVAESGALVLPERRRNDSLNEAFFEKPSILIHTRPRGYSDTRSILRDQKVDKSLVNESSLPKEKTLRKTKSGSLIGDQSNPPCPANPVRCLDLSRNEISNVDALAEQPSTISFHLSGIEDLDLSHNKLTGLPVGLNQNMQRLRKLVLSGNSLNSIPNCVFTCSNLLEWVDLSHNRIKNVNKPGIHFTSFVLHLDLSNNSIEEFPSCVSEGFPLLTYLDLSHNLIKSVATRLENNDENQAHSRGEAINLSKLQTLNLCHNEIATISANFLARLINLETFQASHNKLTFLPEMDLTKLTVVKLSCNNLVEKEPFYLSKFVLSLPNVNVVDLSENGLISVAAPSGWRSQRLKDLNVSCNDIRTVDLTEAASHWPSLTRLDLSNNNLRQIPKEIGELKSLGQLNISGNKRINSLPNEMGNLAKLWEFLYKDVKLDLNASLLRGRTRDLVCHLHARLKKSAPYPQRKVVVCGPQSSGKTTVLRLLASSKALKKPSVKEARRSKNASESLHIQKWTINDVRGDCRCCSRRNVSLVLRVWEFSGDEANVFVHRCFLNETDLHIVVFDASTSAEKKVDELRPWLGNIHDQCPGAMVILVGTHAEKIPASRKIAHLDDISDRIQVIRRLPGIPVIRSISFVNGSKNSNVDDLATKILNLAMACNTRGNQIHNHNMPKSFITLQSIIEGRARNETNNGGVVHLSLLKRIVQDSKLDINNDELHEAVACLRQSGLLVNYAKPAAKLNELFFLSPPKLAALIAKIVTFVVNVANQMELITYDKLCDLIVGEGFSKLHVPQILRLLEDFEITLPLGRCKYLLTSNLARTRPSVLVSTDEMSRRRYTMPYAPVGFWRRLVIYLLLYREEMTFGQRPLIRELEEPITLHPDVGDNQSGETSQYVKILNIFVPQNRHGHITLANLVYFIDSLLQEWYPHLHGVDSMYNRPIIHKTALCPCREHEFPLEECTERYMRCTGGAMIPQEQLVPDLLLANVDQQYIVDESDLIIEENPQSMLGQGGFGSVYRAKYKNKNVAVKIFRRQIDTDPRVHFEQEVRFLARLRHPSVIDLVGVCFGSRYIAILEMAPLGSLNRIFCCGKPLSRGIQHLIAMQIADGLRFLHHHRIVYRDLKPHNILIFSLAAGSLINAKISDFGSSRYTTPCGFIAPEGTPGYRAPEVARGDVVYGEKADIFSLGMLLYELATDGKQPFSDLRFRSEFDEAVITGKPIDPIVVANAPPWPDMQDLLDHMLVTEPEQRLNADQVYQRLNDPEFVSLKQDIAVCKGQAVECMATRYYSDEEGNRKMEVWIGSGASDWTHKKTNHDKNTHMSQLSRVDLSSSKPKGCKGTILQDGRIISMTVVGESFILVGTRTGHLWLYDCVNATFLHAISKLRDAVLCLLYVESVNHVFAGIANGQLAMYSVDELKNPSSATKIIDISGTVCCHEQPMMCLALTKHSRKLLCGLGHNIVVFQLGLPDTMKPESCLSISPEADPHGGLVSNIIDDKHGIWTSTKGSPRIQLWNMKTKKLRANINCDNLPISETFENNTRGMRVVSMLIRNNILWVGTGGGDILLIDTRTSSLLMAMSRHKTAVRCLMNAELLQEDGKQISVVLSGGLGFVPRWSSSRESSSRDFGYVLVWESGIQKESEHLHEYNKRRQEWHLNHSNM